MQYIPRYNKITLAEYSIIFSYYTYPRGLPKHHTSLKGLRTSSYAKTMRLSIELFIPRSKHKKNALKKNAKKEKAKSGNQPG